MTVKNQTVNYAKDHIKVFLFFDLTEFLLANYNLFEFERPKNEDYMVLECYKGE